ncbi:unnamed protein product [Trichobilharzia szidati]|nr:unnamed protein product [Trichobilharzia szidati]
MHWPCIAKPQCKGYFIYPQGRNSHQIACSYAIKQRIHRWTLGIRKKCGFIQERNYLINDDEVGCVKLSRMHIQTYKRQNILN